MLFRTEFSNEILKIIVVESCPPILEDVAKDYYCSGYLVI